MKMNQIENNLKQKRNELSLCDSKAVFKRNIPIIINILLFLTINFLSFNFRL